jgi:hypothetical protein
MAAIAKADLAVQDGHCPRSVRVWQKYALLYGAGNTGVNEADSDFGGRSGTVTSIIQGTYSSVGNGKQPANLGGMSSFSAGKSNLDKKMIIYRRALDHLVCQFIFLFSSFHFFFFFIYFFVSFIFVFQQPHSVELWKDAVACSMDISIHRRKVEQKKLKREKKQNKGEEKDELARLEEVFRLEDEEEEEKKKMEEELNKDTITLLETGVGKNMAPTSLDMWITLAEFVFIFIFLFLILVLFKDLRIIRKRRRC